MHQVVERHRFGDWFLVPISAERIGQLRRGLPSQTNYEIAATRRLHYAGGRTPEIMFCQNSLFVVLSCACCIAAHGAEVHFTVLDFDNGKHLPCRIHMKDAAGKPIRP